MTNDSAKCMINTTIEIELGSLCSRLRGSLSTPTREPDLDNANVGMSCCEKADVSCLAQLLFYIVKKSEWGNVSTKIACATARRIEGERPVSVRQSYSDGKPCSGVRGNQRVSTEQKTGMVSVTYF